MIQEICTIDSLFSTCRAYTEYPTTAYFSRQNRILLQKKGLVFKFYCKFVQYFVYERCVCLALFFRNTKLINAPQFIRVKTDSVNKTYNMKVKVLAMFFLLPLFCSAQITMDDDCFDRSNRIFAKVILEVFDTSFVHKMVDNGQRFLLVLNVDTAGYVLGVRNGYVLGVRNGRGNFPETQVKEMTDKLREYFQTNMVQFPLCYVLQDIGLSSEDQLKLARKIFSEKKERLFGANFPGGLFFPYEADKRKGFEGSKFDYLLQRISGQEIPIKKK